MTHSHRAFLIFTASAALSIASLLPTSAKAQDTPKDTSTNSSAKTEQWIHVRVDGKGDKDETVRVNVPIEMAVKIFPAINKDHLRNGKVYIDDAHLHDVDLPTLLDAIRSSKDGEYVTVQSRDGNVRVAKSGGYLYIHVTDGASHHKSSTRNSTSADKDTVRSSAESKVEIKIPMKVVDALFSAGKDELDVVAALRVLSASGDTELVSVKDNDDTVHIWIDSKNVSD